MLWRRDLAAAGFSDTETEGFSQDGLSVYLIATRGGRRGVWTWPLAGGEPRLLVAFDDPQLIPYGPPYEPFSVDGNRIYLTVAQNESDIWVMNLRR